MIPSKIQQLDLTSVSSAKTEEKVLDIGTPRTPQKIVACPFSAKEITLAFQQGCSNWTIANKYFSPDIFPLIQSFLSDPKCPVDALCFDSCHWDASSIEAWFKEVEYCGRIVVLEIKNGLLDDDTCQAIQSNMSYNAVLKTIRLANVRLTSNGLVAISDGAYYAANTLQKLTFENCHHTPHQQQLINAEYYGERNLLHELKDFESRKSNVLSWRISGKLIHDQVQKNINSFLSSPSCFVRSISLIGGYVTESQLKLFLDGVRKSNAVTTIHFENLSLSSECFKVIGKSLKSLKKVRDLQFVRVRIIAEHLAMLTKGICASKICKAIFESCHLNAECGKSLAKIIQHSKLKVLDLQKNPLGSNMPALSPSVSRNTNRRASCSSSPTVTPSYLCLHPFVPSQSRMSSVLKPIQETQAIMNNKDSDPIKPDYASLAIKKIAAAWSFSSLQRLDLYSTNLGQADLLALSGGVQARIDRICQAHIAERDQLLIKIKCLNVDSQVMVALLERSLQSTQPQNDAVCSIMNHNIKTLTAGFTEIIKDLDNQVQILDREIEDLKFPSAKRMSKSESQGGNTNNFAAFRIASDSTLKMNNINVVGNGFEMHTSSSYLTTSGLSPRTSSQEPKMIMESSERQLTRRTSFSVSASGTRQHHHRKRDSVSNSETTTTTSTTSEAKGESRENTSTI